MNQKEYYVPKNYELNPETDVVLDSGDKLENGMVVLVGDRDFRVLDEIIVYHDEAWREKVLLNHRPLIIHPPYDKYDSAYPDGAMSTVREALRFNRWCTVTHLKRRQYPGSGEFIVFTGVYDDESEFDFFIGVNVPWIVKKESM